MKYKWHTYRIGDQVRANSIVDENGEEVLSISMFDDFFIFENGITDPDESQIAQAILNGINEEAQPHEL